MSVGGIVAAVIWTCIALAAIDVACGVAFAPPVEGIQAANNLQRYFEYGRSVEGKLRQMLHPNYHRPGSLLVAGWTRVPGVEAQEPTARPGRSDRLRVFGYGMSFNNRVLRALDDLDPDVEIELSAGPSASLNHSFTNYLAERADRFNAGADVVVIGILDHSLPGIHAMTNATRMFESPAPMSYPRYLPDGNGDLRVTDPPYRTLSEFEALIGDRERWRDARARLRRDDVFYNPWVYESDLADRSTIGRMIRRAYAQRWLNATQARYVSAGRFSDQTGVIDEAIAIIERFDALARSDGSLPVIILFNTRYSTALYDALGPAMKQRGILFVSSHEVAPPDDRSVFLPDSHFRPKYDRLIAERLRQIIRDNLPAPR